MKKSLVLIYFFSALVDVSQFAWALPSVKVGDKFEQIIFAEVKANSKHRTATAFWIDKNEIISYDATHDTFTYRNSYSRNGGKPIITTITNPASGFRSLEQIQNILAHCSDQPGGLMETIVIPAGTFKACRIEHQGTFRWISNVPNGVIQQKPMHLDDDEVYFIISATYFNRRL